MAKRKTNSYFTAVLKLEQLQDFSNKSTINNHCLSWFELGFWQLQLRDLINKLLSSLIVKPPYHPPLSIYPVVQGRCSIKTGNQKDHS